MNTANINSSSPLIPDWMHKLAEHYWNMRRTYPKDRLLIMFDIDGTILDTRYMILHVLRSFDTAHHTRHFVDLKIEDIVHNENQVDEQLKSMNLEAAASAEVMSWYLEQRWGHEAVLESHKPFRGVLEVIRWFQLQPNTSVGLNTGRFEDIREDTLRSLNQVGNEYRVEFTDGMLYMNRAGWDTDVENMKAGGVRYFRKMGYRVIAFIDNEPQNLAAVATVNDDDEIMLFHASTLFESSRSYIPEGTVTGESYELTALISEDTAPRHIQFVWHGTGKLELLDRFLESNIRWIELDVRLDPRTRELIIRHADPEEQPIEQRERVWGLIDILREIQGASKAVKLDIKGDERAVQALLDLLENLRIDDESLWFNANIERILESGFRKLSATYPYAVLQSPVDFMAPMIIGAPAQAKAFLELLNGWGINRFSINWHTRNKRQVINQLDKWGLDLNIYNIPNLESFFKAALLQPRSISSMFGLPDWE